MQGPITKERLLNYTSLKMEIENQLERLERTRSNAQLPTMKAGDGSQRSIYVNDRLSMAVIRNLEQEERIKSIIEDNQQEMLYIETEINHMSNPMQREVLRLRYLDSEYYKPMPWTKISENIYGDSDESRMRATYRLHGCALKSIYEQTFEK